MAGVRFDVMHTAMGLLVALLVVAHSFAQPPAAADRVVEVRIVGNQTIPAAKIVAQLRTRAGRPFDLQQVQDDVRKLAKLGWFIDVQPLYERVDGGRIVIFRVTQRPTLRWVKYLGNKKIRDKTLAKETGLKVGDAVDPYAVEEGRRKIEEFYRSRGFNKAQVAVLDGNKTGDKGATYVITEGQAQRIRSVRFIGNTIASNARLKTQIQSKPGVLWLFRGFVDRAKLDEDVDRLTSYYRSLGFFGARVGRMPELNEKGNWMTLTFVIHEGPRYVVRDVSFLGNERFSSAELASDLKLGAGNHFSQARMNGDLATLRDMYGGEGYVFADIQADPRFLQEPGTLDLIYHVEEGQRYRVGQITVNIRGDSPHTRVHTVLNRLSLRTGDIVDIRKIRADERRLRASGLFLTDPTRGVGPRIVFTPPDLGGGGVAEQPQRGSRAFRGQSPDGRAIDLQLEGRWRPPPATDQFAPAAPRVRGKSAGIRTTVVARGQSPATGSWPAAPAASFGGQTPRSLGPGSQPYTVYQNRALAPPAAAPGAPTAANAPLMPGPPLSVPPASAANDAGDSFALFPNGRYEPVTAPTYQPSLPLEVQVEETQTGRFMVGVGVNSDAGVVGSVVVDEQNFDLCRFPTSFEDFRNGTAFRGRGQRFRMELLPGSRVQRYLLNFQEPYLWDTPISLGLSGFYFDRRYFDWDEQRVGGRISFGYQLTPDLSGTLAYRGEQVSVFNPRVPGLPELEEVLGDNSLHGFKFTLAHDTRDSAFLATEGHFIQAGIEQVIGDFDYPRATGDFRQYFLIHQRPDGSGRHVLSAGTRLGFSGSNTPVYDNFFAGGYSTLRGFDFRAASPRKQGVYVGGEFMWINTLEYLLPVTADDMLRAVVFCDFGTVEEKIENNNFRVAPGVGLRVTVPALGPAPIALDFAFPVLRAVTDDEQIFSFNVGLQR